MNQNRRKNRGGPQTASFESRATRQRGAVVADGVYNNPHFMYAATSQVGNIVRIQVASGTVWEGIFRTFSAQFEIVLEMACKVDNPDSHNSSLSAESHVDKLIFKPCDIVTMCAREVDLDFATRDTFQTDAAISSRLNGGQGREEKELEPWEGPCANGQLGDGGLDLLEPGSNGWDANEMFRKNEQKYGVQSTYDHSLSGYTVPLQHSDSQDYREAEAKANEIAAEIESQPSYKSRLELENGDEEERFAAVQRPGGGGNSGRGHHHHDYMSKETTPSDKYVPPNKRKGSQSTGKIMRSTPPPSSNQNQPPPAHQAPLTAQNTAHPPPQNAAQGNHHHPKASANVPVGNNISMQPATYAAHVQHHPQNALPAQAPPQQQQAPPPQQQSQQQPQGHVQPSPQQQQQQQQQQPPPQQNQQPPPQHMNHARHTPPHAHVYNQSMPPRGKQLNGDHMNMGPGGPGGGGGGGMKGMQRPPRNVYGGMNQGYDKVPQHVQHAQHQEVVRQHQQQQQQQLQPPPQHERDMKELMKFSKDFKLGNASEMVQQQQQQMVGVPPLQQQQQEVKLPLPQQTPSPPQQSVSPRLQGHPQQNQEHQEEKSSAVKGSKLNPLAKEFVMKPFSARSPSTPTASRPHTPQTPSNQYIATTVNGPPAGQPMPQLMMPMPAMYAVSQQQFQQPVQGGRVRKVMGQVRTDMASQMQVAAATGQPLLAPAPMQQFVYQQGINPQAAYQQMHMRMDGYPPIQYIQQPNPSQAPSPAQQQQYAQAGAPGAPGPGQQYQTAVPPPQGPPPMYLPIMPGQPHLMQPGMYHLQQQAPQTMPLLIANPPPPHQHGPNP